MTVGAAVRALGGWAEAVETTGDFALALAEAMRRNGNRLLHLKTNVEVIPMPLRLQTYGQARPLT